MFALTYAHRAGLMAALPLSLISSVDTTLCDEIAGALVRLTEMTPQEAVLHAFEAQRITITPAIADSVVSMMNIAPHEIEAARQAIRRSEIDEADYSLAA
jgi:predicted outer membrane protein